jgi:osmoprotectant transport system permease protein
VISLANVGRALPTLAVIALLLVLVGIGFTNIVIALTLLAIPPILTHAYVGIDQVDRDVVEAGRGMGMREVELLLRLEIPLALPLIFGGLRTSVVFVISTAPLAALAGGEGLGVIIVNQPSYGLSGVIAATIWVAVLAVGADFALGRLEWLVLPSALRRSRFLATEARLESELRRELMVASAGH